MFSRRRLSRWAPLRERWLARSHCVMTLCDFLQALQSGERAPVEPRRPLGASGGAGGNLQRACSWLGGVPPPAKPVVKRLLLVRARSRFYCAPLEACPACAHCLSSYPTPSVSANLGGMDLKYTMSTVEIPADVEPSGRWMTSIGTRAGGRPAAVEPPPLALNLARSIHRATRRRSGRRSWMSAAAASAQRSATRRRRVQTCRLASATDRCVGPNQCPTDMNIQKIHVNILALSL